MIKTIFKWTMIVLLSAAAGLALGTGAALYKEHIYTQGYTAAINDTKEVTEQHIKQSQQAYMLKGAEAAGAVLADLCNTTQPFKLVQEGQWHVCVSEEKLLELLSYAAPQSGPVNEAHLFNTSN